MGDDCSPFFLQASMACSHSETWGYVLDRYVLSTRRFLPGKEVMPMAFRILPTFNGYTIDIRIMLEFAVKTLFLERIPLFEDQLYASF
jgi:hypothetical protein